MELEPGSTRKEGVTIYVNESMYSNRWSLAYKHILFQIWTSME